ncbi:o-succinylbenzoate synthase [Salinigranum rubrum]|uniref:o-succinylbenzoate synthase n=1 Tax=Salinigranum rubrum TaxID=755307 RepID=A0A2I8VGV8_9EURY|nr:o-succinylbenzoate synthase [Salinigranum rubrum]AUV81167.1 o-succinylbenzoate synthase [Salinigranum rubrum]
MSVDVTPFELPLARPLSTARGDIEARRGFVVRGSVGDESGVGEATPLPGWTESYDDCRRALDIVDDLGAALSSTVLDDAPAARHAVSLALFDARARGEGVSLARFLAGPEGRVSDAVPVNATVGDASEDETADAVEDAVASGYDCVKLKVGVGGVERDVERLVAARDASSEATLRVDANGAWTTEEATRFVEGVSGRGVDLAYVEQPLAPEDVEGHAAFRAECPFDVAVDETLGRKSVDEVLAADAADVLVVKPMALGGPGRTLAVAEQAREAGVESVVTTTIDAAVARVGALHVAAALVDPPACGLATGDLLKRDLAPDPTPVIDGEMRVPEGPGLAGEAFAALGLDG